MKYLLCIIICYSLGAVNPSYLISRARGFDIRERGSGNAGASNALMLLGKLTGVLCAAFDIGKAALAVLLCEKLFGLKYCFAVSAVSCIFGHIFPFYMKFRGGKGLACIGGVVLAFDLRVFLLMLACAVALVLVTKYICFVPLSAAVVFPAVYGIMRQDLWGALILCTIVPVVFFRHRENLSRIRRGKEMRISFLWSREKELERMGIRERDTR